MRESKESEERDEEGEKGGRAKWGEWWKEEGEWRERGREGGKRAYSCSGGKRSGSHPVNCFRITRDLFVSIITRRMISLLLHVLGGKATVI